MIKFPEEAKNLFKQPLPDGIIKQRDGARGQKLSYISGSTVIDMLNRAFDHMWSWEVIREWVQPSEPKLDYKTKEPIPQGPVAHVLGKLVVYLQDGENMFSLVRYGYGSKAVIGGQSEQESIFKAAATDALKKAASTLGLGLQLYRDEEEQQFFDELNYINPWTDEMLEKYAEEREFINQLVEENDFSTDDLDYLVQEFSGGILNSFATDIVPENIKAFVDYLKQRINDNAA